MKKRREKKEQKTERRKVKQEVGKGENTEEGLMRKEKRFNGKEKAKVREQENKKT